MDIVDKKIGDAEVKGSFQDGMLVLELAAKYAAGETSLVQKVDAKVVLDAIGKLGSVEKAVVDVIEAAVFPQPKA